MIARLAAKTSLLGSVGSAAYISTIIYVPDNNNDNNKSASAVISEKQRKQFQTSNWRTMTLQDVEMFEKRRNCKFAFTDDFTKNKNYTVREWFNEKVKLRPNKKESLREEFAIAVFYNKQHCKPGKVLVIAPNQYGNLAAKLSY